MGMNGVLIAMSKARVELIHDDEELLRAVIDARRETDIPSLVSLDKAWDALDVLLSQRGKDALLGDAVSARSGIEFGPLFAHGRGRLLSQARTREVAHALEALPPDTIRSRYGKLSGQGAHGGYGPKKIDMGPPSQRDDVLADDCEDTEREGEIEELETRFRALVALYVSARAKHQAMYALVLLSWAPPKPAGARAPEPSSGSRSSSAPVGVRSAAAEVEPEPVVGYCSAPAGRSIPAVPSGGSVTRSTGCRGG